MPKGSLDMRWAIKLDGMPSDLEIWSQRLPELSAYRVEKVPQGEKIAFALSGVALQELISTDEVRAKADAVIDQLNGVMWLVENVRPVSFGDLIFELGPNGEIGATSFPKIGSITFRGFRPQILIDGVPMDSLSEDDLLFKRAFTEAERSDDVADLLTFVGRADNWFDLYKAIELTERLVGGEHGLQKLMGDRGKALKNARTTANFHRHSPRHKHTHKPEVLSTIHETRNLLTCAVKVALQHTFSSAAK